MRLLTVLRWKIFDLYASWSSLMLDNGCCSFMMLKTFLAFASLVSHLLNQAFNQLVLFAGCLSVNSTIAY